MEDKNIAVQTETVTDTAAVDSKNAVINRQKNQGEESTSKTFSLKEFNDAMAAVRKKTEENVLKKFSDVDVEKYRDLLHKEEQRQLDEQKKRGEFEKILKETAEKKDQEINKLRNSLNSVKIDGALLNAASKYKAVNPDQVSKLIRENVRLNANGDVEVWGENNAPRYTESGELMTVDQFVGEFLQSNPHFVNAGPSGSGAKSNTNTEGLKAVDFSKLDLVNNPEHRKLYAEYRKQRDAGYKRI